MDKKLFYSKNDIENIDENHFSDSGTFPFTRGIHKGMYTSRLWTMRQYSGFGSAKETNKRFLFLLKQGQTGISVAFDLPTQIGLDSDDRLSRGEVGRTGVAIDSLEDMEVLFRDIPLENISTSMTINSTASILLCLYIALAEKRGIPIENLRGTIQNDILKEYIARGTYIYPPKESMRLIVNIFEYCSKSLPKWNTISISGYHIREAGSSAVQEVAFTIANGIAYVNAAIKAGLDPNEFGKRISFFFNAHNDFFEEIAKFRAARKIWAKIMRDKFKVTDQKALKLRFHTQTGGSTLTAQQPENNTVRVAYQALAAVLGGTQSLHTNSRDEALSLPTTNAAQLALRTQQIIANETEVTEVVDPLGGSFYIESKTNSIEEKVWKYLNKIEKSFDGMINAIENGYPQREIHSSAYNYQKKIERREKIVVGINKFETDQQLQIPTFKFDDTIEKNQIANLKKFKTNRNMELVSQSLNNLKQAAIIPEVNLIPLILKCIKTNSTVGEISNALREVWGEYKAPEIL